MSALMAASEYGHTEVTRLLLTAPDIIVNYAKVSLYLLTPSHLVVGGGFNGRVGGRGVYLTLSLPLSNPHNDDLSSPKA